MPNRRWLTKNELTWIFEGSFSHNVMPNIHCVFILYYRYFCFSFPFLWRVLWLYIMSSSLRFLWDSWVGEPASLWNTICFFCFFLDSYIPVFLFVFLLWRVNFVFLIFYFTLSLEFPLFFTEGQESVNSYGKDGERKLGGVETGEIQTMIYREKSFSIKGKTKNLLCH